PGPRAVVARPGAGRARRGPRGAVPSLTAQPASAWLDTVGLSLPFEIVGVLQLVNAWLLYGFFRHTRPAEEDAVAGTPSGDTAAARERAPRSAVSSPPPPAPPREG
ncbi:hypothetical protein, partial [Segeticoccus rhizosphaerae]|uniref:hypothetical protein n=1 Tax=Segeticoccus rhizosphaerae TaxID=1104777 RepID=UPI001939AE96